MIKKTVSLRGLFAILCLCLMSSCVYSREFYVSTQGRDTHSGTESKPFRTLARAVEKARAGDTVIVRAGIYRETLRLSHSGARSMPLTFVAAKNEKVIITGADLAGDWRPYKGSILQTKIPKELERGFNQVFLNGRMLHMARFPNETSEDLHNQTFAEMNAGADVITSKHLTQPDGFWKGGFVVGGFERKWTFQCADIKDYKDGRLILANKSNPWYSGKGKGYVSGVLAALDAPGEWHIENGVLYLWPPEGTDMSLAHVEVKQRNLCIDFNGQSHVVIRGIDVLVGSVRMVGYSCMLENSRITYPSHFTRFPWGGMASDGGVDKGHNGVLVKGDNNTIQGCTIKYSAGSGIVIRGEKNLITRCEISDIDYSGTYSCPVTLRTVKDKAYGNNRIWFNTIHRTGRDCIHMRGALADDIRYNDISDSGLICKDLGLVYVWGRDGQGTRIAYNWIHDNRGHGPNPGVYLDNFCRNFIVDHNVIWNCEAGVRVNGPAEGHRVYNNTLFNCEEVGTHTYKRWPPPPHMKAKWPTNVYQYEKANNLFLGRNPNQQLQNVDRLKFWLKPDADAIDSGKQIMGFTDGFHGKAPDLGAYESSGVNWVPGKNGTGKDKPAAGRKSKVVDRNRSAAGTKRSQKVRKRQN